MIACNVLCSVKEVVVLGDGRDAKRSCMSNARYGRGRFGRHIQGPAEFEAWTEFTVVAIYDVAVPILASLVTQSA